MQCQSCRFDNPEGTRFCEECGTELAQACPACGVPVRPTQRFCGACGARQAAETRPAFETPPRVAPTRDVIEGEHKQVTVLFADVRDSLALIGGGDAERAHAILRDAVAVMTEAVHRFEGTVNKTLGDGIMALFGAPVAREDHAVRACCAALAMQEGMRRFAEQARQTWGFEIAVRVGLNSGDVVVRAASNDLGLGYDAVGSAVHLASRLEQLAEPGETCLSAATYRAARGAVDAESLGRRQIKGWPDAIEVYRLRAAGIAAQPSPVPSFDFARCVGREAALAELDSLAARADGGQGQAAVITGEAGIGKTRLCHEFARSAAARGMRVLEAAASAHRGAALALIADLLRRLASIAAGDDERTQRDKLAAALRPLGEAAQVELPLLALLGLAPAGGQWAELEARQRWNQVMDAARGIFLAASRDRPLVIVIDNAQWLDAESEELLSALVDAMAAARLLLLLVGRRALHPPWLDRSHATPIRLHALDDPSAEGLLDAHLGSDPGLAGLKRRLKERAQGNPFFLIELIRGQVETGALTGGIGNFRPVGELPELAIPDSVQTVVAARIDRLAPDDKHVLQVAAVIGRDVDADLLRAASECSDDALRSSLRTLVRAEFMVETRLFPRAEYRFPQILIQEVAEAGLLQERRRALHARVAAAMKRMGPDRVEERAQILGRHFEAAGDGAAAAHWYLAAATRARRVYALKDSARLCERALGLAGAPDVTARARLLAGDLASLRGELVAANQHYAAGLALAAADGERRVFANKIHHARETTRAGARIVYYEHGSGGPMLVLVNPILYGLATFQPVIDQLCQEFRLITIDARGTGASDALPRGYTLMDHAEDVRAVIEAARDGQPVVGVGISRGGNLLVRLAAAYPGLMDRLALVASPVDDMGPDGMTPPEGDYVEAFYAALKRKDPVGALRVFAPVVLSEPGSGDLVEQWIEAAGRLPESTMFSFFARDREANIVEHLPSVRLPTLVMHGSADRRVPSKLAEFVAGRLPQAQLYLFRDRCHLLFFTATQEFCDVIRRFMRGEPVAVAAS